MPTTTLTTSRWPSAWRSTSWLSSGESLPTSSRATTAGNRVWNSARRINSIRCFSTFFFQSWFNHHHLYFRSTAIIDLRLFQYLSVLSCLPCRMPCSMHQSPRTQSWQRSCSPGSSWRTRGSVSPPACLPAMTCCDLTWCWRPPGGTTSWTFLCHTSFRSWGNTSARWVSCVIFHLELSELGIKWF